MFRLFFYRLIYMLGITRYYNKIVSTQAICCQSFLWWCQDDGIFWFGFHFRFLSPENSTQVTPCTIQNIFNKIDVYDMFFEHLVNSFGVMILRNFCMSRSVKIYDP
jgi:hypothetical protein